MNALAPTNDDDDELEDATGVDCTRSVPYAISTAIIASTHSST